MAIEFNCPYCTAAIRVPDSFSGKRGSCPKCATKLLVPDVAPPATGASAPASGISPNSGPAVNVVTSEAVEAPASAPTQDSDLPPLDATPLPPMGTNEIIPTDFAAAPAAAATDSVPDFSPPSPTSNLSRNLKKKARRKKSQRLYAIGIPVVCFLAFFGVVALVTMFSQPELKGILQASVTTKMEVPPESVSVAQFGLPSADESRAFQAFEDAPESFVSAQMKCTIMLDGSSLAVSVTAMDGFSWFAVNPSGDMTLLEWIRDHQVSINKSRLSRVAENGKQLCLDKIKKAAGDPIVFDAETYRDGFGLSAHVGAFGYVIEAVTNKRRSPCVHEDANGTLYFILPDDTKSFTIRGRKLGQAKPVFPGEYKVNVRVEEPTSPEMPVEESEESTEMQPETSAPDDTQPGMSDSEDSEMTMPSMSD